MQVRYAKDYLNIVFKQKSWLGGLYGQSVYRGYMY